MAARLPILATAVGGNVHVVVDGETGFLVPSENLERLTERLQWLETHRKQSMEMGTKSRARIDEHYSFSHTVQEYTALFQRVLA